MSDQLKFSGSFVAQAGTALSNAGATLVSSGVMSVGADYGAGELDMAIATFTSTFSNKSGASAARASKQSRGAKTAQTSFAQLDSKIAASVPSQERA